MIHVAWDHADAVALRIAMVDELTIMYEELEEGSNRDGGSGIDPGSIVSTVLEYDHGVPVAHAALRRLGDDVEIKRMYIAPTHRGAGLSVPLLEAMEQAARDVGAGRIILHTGDRQIAAIALYERHGYTPIGVYPPYEDMPFSRCFEKLLR